MSRTTVWTMHCKGNGREPCAEEVTGAASEKELVELAESKGWHVDYGVLLVGGYDACPRHIKPLDRVDWSSAS